VITVEREYVEFVYSSLEVAEHCNKSHEQLMRDIPRYIQKTIELNITDHTDLFKPSQEEDEQGNLIDTFRMTQYGYNLCVAMAMFGKR
jgi:phage regulator Rha-like protein